MASPIFSRVYGPYLDSVQEGGNRCIIQPYLGANLLSFMEENGEAYNVATTVDVLRQVLEQLEAAHELQVVHKDVKLDNIVFADRQKYP